MSDLNLRIITKGSSTAGETPGVGDLEVGELAVNTADKKVFTKHSDNTVVTLVDGGNNIENLSELNDVDLATVPPSNGQGLIYDAAGGHWEPTDIVTDINGQNGEVVLRTVDLDDVKTAFPYVFTPRAAGTIRDDYPSTQFQTGTAVSGDSAFIVKKKGDHYADFQKLQLGDPITFSASGQPDHVTTITTVLSNNSSLTDYIAINDTFPAAYETADPITVTSPVFNGLADKEILQWEESSQKFKPVQVAQTIEGMDDFGFDVGPLVYYVYEGSVACSGSLDINYSGRALRSSSGTRYSMNVIDSNGVNIGDRFNAEGWGATPVEVTVWISTDSGLNWSSYQKDAYRSSPTAFAVDLLDINGDAMICSTSGVWFAFEDPAEHAAAEGDVLIYNATNEEYQPKPVAAVTTSGDYNDLINRPSIPGVLNDLNDVDVVTVPPTDGQALVWDNANSQWEPGNAGGGAGVVNSVNGQTGAVVLGIQDMDDYEANVVVQTEYTWTHEAAGGATFAVGEWAYDTQNSGTTSRIKISLVDSLSNDITGQIVSGQTVWCSTKGRTAVAFVADTVQQSQSNSVDIYYLNETVINEIGGGPFVEGDSLVITLAEPGSDAPLVDGEILSWDNSAQKFKPGQPSVASVNGQTGVVSLALDNIADVDQTDILDGQSLIWDGAGTQWIAGYPLLSDPAGSDGTREGRKINELADVKDTAPLDGQFLQYDTTTSEYVPVNLADAAALATTDLTDVALVIDPVSIGEFAYNVKIPSGAPGTGEWATDLLRWGATDSRGASWSTTGSTNFWMTTNGQDWYEETANIQYLVADDYYYIQTSEITLLHQRILDEAWEILYISLNGPTTNTLIPYAENDFLKYDGSRLKFTQTQLATVASSGSYNDLLNQPTFATSIDGLNDVDTSTVPPTDGQALVWDNANSQWEPGTVGGSGSIDNLSDVDTSTVPPTSGQALLWNNTSGNWEPGTISSTGPSRETVVTATASLTNNASEDIVFTAAGKSGTFVTVGTDVAAWITFYTDTTSRTADAARLQTASPSPGSGVLLEVVTTGAETIRITPAIGYFNDDATLSSDLVAKVVNLSGGTTVVTTTIEVVRVEA